MIVFYLTIEKILSVAQRLCGVSVLYYGDGGSL